MALQLELSSEVKSAMEQTLGGLPPQSEPSNNASVAASDLMKSYGLDAVLAEMRSRKLRSSFMHYIAELPTEKAPIKPRCPAGQLAEIAYQPVNEDERVIEEFDERVLRAALALKEGGEPLKMPEWLDEEQPWADEDRRKKKKDKDKDKKKKKKKKKRKRSGDDDEGRLDEEERRLKKKRK